MASDNTDNKPKMGRPPLFNTPDELADAINEYFNKGVKLRKVVLGPPNNRYTDELPVPTITGLVIYLGFESRQSFYDYEDKPDFSYTIKRARLFIENEYEEQLQVGNVTGAIFALKNFGWRDKVEHDISNPDGTLNPLHGISTDELRDYIATLKKGK